MRRTEVKGEMWIQRMTCRKSRTGALDSMAWVERELSTSWLRINRLRIGEIIKGDSG